MLNPGDLHVSVLGGSKLHQVLLAVKCREAPSRHSLWQVCLPALAALLLAAIQPPDLLRRGVFGQLVCSRGPVLQLVPFSFRLLD